MTHIHYLTCDTRVHPCGLDPHDCTDAPGAATESAGDDGSPALGERHPGAICVPAACAKPYTGHNVIVQPSLIMSYVWYQVYACVYICI